MSFNKPKPSEDAPGEKNSLSCFARLALGAGDDAVAAEASEADFLPGCCDDWGGDDEAVARRLGDTSSAGFMLYFGIDGERERGDFKQLCHEQTNPTVTLWREEIAIKVLEKRSFMPAAHI